MTNRRDGILYAGVTSNPPRRAYEHREGLVEAFTKRYGLKMLVCCEYFEDIRDAIQREKDDQALAACLEGSAYTRRQSPVG